MAFALHVNINFCTGCGNCVVACPVDAIELYTIDPVTNEKIYQVRDGKSVVLDIKQELCAGCGVCVGACPFDVIRLAGRGEFPLEETGTEQSPGPGEHHRKGKHTHRE